MEDFIGWLRANTDFGDWDDSVQTEVREKLVEFEEERRIREKLADLLKRTAIALYGPEPPDTMWDWSRIPAEVEKLVKKSRGSNDMA